MFARSKVLAARALCHPVVGRAVARATADRVHRNGVVVDTSDPMFSSSVKAKVFWGLYERAELAMVRRWLDGAETVVELGSSLGVCAAHIAKQMPPGGRLLCVEADSRLLPALRTSLTGNADHLNVTVVHAAVASPTVASQGTASFSLSPVSTASRLSSLQSGGSEMVVEAPAATLGRLLEEHNIKKYGLVCDIEGAEASIILDEPESLAGCQRAVIELHDSDHDGQRVRAAELLDVLTRLGFRVVDRRGNVAFVDRRPRGTRP